MAIADKLAIIAANEQRVYDAGYAAGQAAGGGGGSDRYDEGVADGKKAEYDRFWDAYQGGGERTDYNSGFRSPYWNDETYQPPYAITANSLAAGFATSAITDTKVDISVSSSANQAFQTCKNLKTIRLLTVSERVTYTNCFQNCTALENITFGGTIGQSLDIHWSTLLTHDSIMSIIGALKQGGSGTVTLGATNLAKLTDAEKKIATDKGWTLA